MKIAVVCLLALLLVLQYASSVEARRERNKYSRNRDLFNWIFSDDFGRGRRHYANQERRKKKRTKNSYSKITVSRKMFFYWDNTYGPWSNWSKCRAINCVKTRFRKCIDKSWNQYVSDFKIQQKCPVQILFERKPCNDTIECNSNSKNQTRVKGNSSVSEKTLPEVCGNRPPRIRTKVFGGSDSRENAWPWHVGLYVTGLYKSVYICGGTLINSGWVLTAAHCLTSIKELNRLPLGQILNTRKHGFHTTFKVVIGGHNRGKSSKKEVVSRLSHVILHPEFIADYTANIFDVALLKLDTIVKRSRTIDFACLPNSNFTLPTDTQCYAIGWGNTRSQNPFDFWSYEFSWIYDNRRARPRRPSREKFQRKPTILQEVILPLVDFKKCRKVYRYFNLKEKLHICAGSQDRDTCRGDSGGGLFCKEPSTDRYQLYGITNFGSARGCGKNYGVYVRVSAVYDWVKEIIKSNPV